MADSESIVFTLATLGKRRQATGFLDRANAVPSAGEYLVRICLVADIPDNPFMRCFEALMQGDGQFNTTQSRA